MIGQTLRTHLVSWAIRTSVPVLNVVRRPAPWPTLEELDLFPAGSLGREVADYMRSRGLPFLAHYENHDAIHLLLGYDTDARGEMELQAWMWGNDSSSFAGGVLFFWGAAMLPEHWQAMREAYKRGRRAHAMREARLPFRLEQSLERVRQRIEPRRRS
jgi:ubiquinone biosynthesis protein COQ4